MQLHNSLSTITTQDEKLIFAMQLLGDRTRYKIFKILKDNKQLCVGEIAEILGISISAVSQHFRNFEQIGLVDKQRIGQKICYLLKEDELVKNINSLIDNISSNERITNE